VARIKEVIPKEDYQLEVQLDNGSSVMLNMKSRLGTVRFSMLEDRNFFKKVTTDGNQVLWGDEVEISVREVFQLAQK
jgi:hypothetical protein